MTNQELLDSIVIKQSSLTKRIYIGLPDKNDQNILRCKSDFTERIKEFAPQLFKGENDD